MIISLTSVQLLHITEAMEAAITKLEDCHADESEAYAGLVAAHHVLEKELL